MGFHVPFLTREAVSSAEELLQLIKAADALRTTRDTAQVGESGAKGSRGRLPFPSMYVGWVYGLGSFSSRGFFCAFYCCYCWFEFCFLVHYLYRYQLIL